MKKKRVMIQAGAGEQGDIRAMQNYLGVTFGRRISASMAITYGLRLAVQRLPKKFQPIGEKALVVDLPGQLTITGEET